MNIVLIGFMGSGKSSVAQNLGEKTGFPVIEMDDLIVRRSGQKSVNEIFAREGEIRFREFEVDVARGLRHKEHTIISTGGGVIMNGIIIEYLKINGSIVFLNALFETICSRLKGDATRPKFQDKEAAKALYEFRLPLYRKYADMIISTEGKTPEKIAEEIIKNLTSSEPFSITAFRVRT